MIRAVRANQPGFHTATFTTGVNLVLADRSSAAGDKDTTNALGKSTLIEALAACAHRAVATPAEAHELLGLQN